MFAKFQSAFFLLSLFIPDLIQKHVKTLSHYMYILGRSLFIEVRKNIYYFNVGPPFYLVRILTKTDKMHCHCIIHFTLFM